MRALSSKRAQRFIAAGVALAATSGTAALAFTGQPGANAAPVTNAPDLVSVTLAADNAYGDRQAATFCFDADLTTSYNPANFFVKTYDANRFLQGTTAAVDASSSKCVIVTFNPRIDLAKQGSIGEVDGNAVTGTSGVANYFSSAPLTGSALAPRAGQTTGPDLIGATPRQSDHTVEYAFDQQVDGTPANINVDRFKVTDNAGTSNDATALVGVDTATSSKVRVQFADGVSLSDATGFSAGRGAVRTLDFDGLSAGGVANPYAPTTTFILSSPGVVQAGTPNLPVLKGAQQRAEGSSQFTLTYSTDIGDFDATKIIAVRDNGEVEAATSSAPVAGSTTQKIVSFAADGAVDREPGGVISIVSQPGAAKDSTNTKSAPISATAIGSAPFKPGLTNGPDLLNTQLDATASQASFIYDEAVDTTAIGAPSSFQLLVANGSPIGGVSQGGVSSDKKTVIIGFPGSIESGVGVSTGLGATQDRVGNLQQYTSVSSTVVTLDPNGNPTPVPSTTPPPAAVTVATKISIKHRRGSRRFTGKVKTKSPCKRRLVKIVRGSKRLKSKRSKKSGKYSIRFKKAPSGKVRAKVSRKTVVKDGVTYTCLGAKSRKVRA